MFNSITQTLIGIKKEDVLEEDHNRYTPFKIVKFEIFGEVKDDFHASCETLCDFKLSLNEQNSDQDVPENTATYFFNKKLSIVIEVQADSTIRCFRP